MKRNIGDKVIIKNNLITNEYYKYDYIINEDMVQYNGQIAIVTYVDIINNEYYLLSIDDGEWCWTNDMLEDTLLNNNIIILVNEDDDALLYLNGKSYQDIDLTWVDCIDFLRNILTNVNISIINHPKDRKDFPDIINEEDFKY